MNPSERIDKQSDLPIGLSKPAQRALYEAGYLQIEQLTKVSETELKQLHGIGPNAIEKLRCALDAKGLSFADGKSRKEQGVGIQMDMKLEVVPVPVSDVDRAKAFYIEKVGFNVDHDVQPGNGIRVVQLTPPGSSCSIVIGTGLGEISEMQPGTVKALHLVVADITKAREALAGRGVEVGEVEDRGGIKFVHFSDPDGNSWLLQEIPAAFISPHAR